MGGYGCRVQSIRSIMRGFGGSTLGILNPKALNPTTLNP